MPQSKKPAKPSGGKTSAPRPKAGSPSFKAPAPSRAPGHPPGAGKHAGGVKSGPVIGSKAFGAKQVGGHALTSHPLGAKGSKPFGSKPVGPKATFSSPVGDPKPPAKPLGAPSPAPGPKPLGGTKPAGGGSSAAKPGTAKPSPVGAAGAKKSDVRVGDSKSSKSAGDSSKSAGERGPALQAMAGKTPSLKTKSGGKSSELKAPREPAKPVEPRKWPKGGPSRGDINRYRDRLLTMRRDLLSSSTELAAEALQAGGGEFSVDHMADHGSDNYEQDFNLKLLEGEAAQLAEIRDALLKLDGKADLPFGGCEACADQDLRLCPTCPWIDSSRLDVIPYARLCVQAKELEEKRSK